jgi:hypothetical protein
MNEHVILEFETLNYIFSGQTGFFSSETPPDIVGLWLEARGKKIKSNKSRYIINMPYNIKN